MQLSRDVLRAKVIHVRRELEEELREESGFKKPLDDLETFNSIIVNADDLIKLDVPIRKIILAPWLYEGAIILVYAWRGFGKTWLMISIVDSISRGENFGPWVTQNPVPTLYLDGEMALCDIQERFRLLSRGKGPRKTQLIIYNDDRANSLGFPRANLLDQIWRERFKKFLTTTGIKLLVLDNIASLAAGIDENSKQSWDPVNQWLLDLRFAGITTVLLHHSGKGGDQRGTSAREDNLDVSIMLRHPPDYLEGDGARFIVDFKKARVRGSELSLINGYEFHLMELQDRVEWAWVNVKGKNRIEILEILGTTETKQAEVAAMFNVTPQYVSKLKREFNERALLDKHGRLTKAGFETIAGREELVN
jgi:putative DNA primase/helicase